MTSAVFQGGGDYAASRYIIGSGENALMVRNFTGYRTLGDKDQLQLEFGGAYRHYHSCLMRTILTGEASPQQVAMHAACCDALQACKEAARPGSTFGDIFTAHADALDRAGFGEHRLNACGYSLGALYPPTWMDWPMIFRDNPVEVRGQHGHLHAHDPAGLGPEAGHVGGGYGAGYANGCETLTKMGTDLVVN